MAVGDLIELELTEMVYGGNAFGRHEGRSVFVAYGLPGERVEARVTEDKGRYAVAVAERILQPSPDRVTPRCIHFGPGLCGGCRWQHADYAAQLRYKQQSVRDQLTRFGGLRDIVVHETIPSPDAWAYRAHATLHVADDGRLGYVRTDGRTILPLEDCPIIQPDLLALIRWLPSEAVAALKHVRVQIGSGGELMVAVSEDEDYPQFRVTAPDVRPDAGEHTEPMGRKYVEVVVKGWTFRVTGGSFFQVNLPQAETLVDLVLERLDLRGHERVLDLYSGVGLFTAFLAPLVHSVVAVESAESSVDDAAVNLAEADNVLLVQDTVERGLPRLSGRFDAAVVDPPRSGLGERAIRALIEKRPGRIVYVSCDPSSLARDVKALVAAGYTASEAQPVDMFPQTPHVETVMVFALV